MDSNFDPKTIKFPYPAQTDGHYLHVKKNDGTVFDKDYPYIDLSPKFIKKQKMVRFLLRTIVFHAISIRMGLRIKGREKLKQYRKSLQNGAISVSNHVHICDYISIMNALMPRKTNILVWAPNVSGENGFLVRMVGGIPIPEKDPEATRSFNESIDGLFDRKGWLHIYPEGSMWEYYRPIRPFKIGAAYYSQKYGIPILPMAYSYRRPNWMRRVIFRQIACFTLSIGEPIYPDHSKTGAEQINDLTRRAHEAVCSLAGIEPKENVYPPIFSKNKRVDYYSSIYGVNYRGSH